MTSEQREQAIDLYVKQGWSYKKVGRHLRLGDATVRAALAEEGVIRDRQDYDDLGHRIGAARAKIPLGEFKRQIAQGKRYCWPCSREAGQHVWHLAGEMSRDGRPGRYSGYCRAQRRRRDGRCMDKRYGCGVRWGKHQHRHCPEPLRVMEDGTVFPCNLPMVLDADRCATCEALRLLQERIDLLEDELRLRTGRRLPSLVEDARVQAQEAAI